LDAHALHAGRFDGRSGEGSRGLELRHTGNFFQKRSQQSYLKDTRGFNSELKYDEALL
jgi:hypothetical protein